MAKLTEEQKAAAAKKRAEAKAAKDAAAAKAVAEATKSDAKPSTDQTPNTETPAGTNDALAQGTGNQTGDQQGTTGETQTPDAPSIFDQAVGFSMAGHSDGSGATEARELWDALHCDEMPPELAVAVFDCAIHQGQKVAERLLIKIADHLDRPVSAEAVDEVVTEFLAWRLRRYAFTGNVAANMRDWSKHILKLQTFILFKLQTGALIEPQA
jgi:hypothetical protein